MKNKQFSVLDYNEMYLVRPTYLTDLRAKNLQDE